MLIDTFAAYVDARLQSWARACVGGHIELGYPGTNILHPKHGVSGRCTEFTELDWQTEEIIRSIRQEVPMEAIALEHVYFRGQDEKRENGYFRTAFDKVKKRFWDIGHPS